MNADALGASETNMSLSDFISGYKEAALWSTTDESTPSGGHPLDKNYSPRDLDEPTRRQMQMDCAAFYDANERHWDGTDDQGGLSDERAGNRFWLNRNGHGTGFWDDDGLNEANQEFLSKASQKFGAFDLSLYSPSHPDWTPDMDREDEDGDEVEVLIEGFPLSDAARQTNPEGAFYSNRRSDGGVDGLGAPRGEADEAAATELQLFIDNDGDLYRSQTQSIHANAAKKVASGKYDPVLAVKLWRYLVDAGAKKYAKEFSVGSDWSRMFNVPTRDLVASRMATEWYDEHQIQHGHGGTHGLGDTSLHDSDGFGAGLGMWNPRR